MRNLNRERSNIIKSGDSAILNIFNQMPYTFTKTEDYVIIGHTVDPYLFVTRQSCNVSKNSNTISIFGLVNGGFNLNIPIDEVGAIDGVVPSDGDDAVLKLGLMFKGYSPIKITVG